MYNKLKLLALFVFVFVSFGTFLTSAKVDAGEVRCAYGRCNNNSDCNNGGICKDLNGDGKKECDNGICQTNSDCYGAKNGGVAVCRDENGDGLKECANAFCPIGKTIPGANCDCSAGRTCGQTCNASVGLCGDGKSTCRYIVGPNCRVSKPFQDDTTYCVPGGAPGIVTHKCVARDQYNSYALYNGSNPTVAQLTQLCAEVLCQPSSPVAATLTTPANNSQVVLGTNNSVGLVYNVNNGWGVACPANNNSYDVQLSYNCSGTYASWGQVTAFNSLQKGATYCWRVAKDNGSGVKVYSSTYRFTVVDDRVNLSSGSLKADVCGGGFSGLAGTAGVTNPIEYGFQFTTSSSNKYKEAWLAMVPDSTAYNTACPAFGGGNNISNNVCQNMEAADVQSEAILLQKVKNANGVAFKLILDASNNITEARAYNGTSWTSITSQGNVSGLGGTLIGFKTGETTATVTGSTTLNANFKIKLDSVPLGKYSFYTAAVITDALGNTKTSYSTPGNSFVYKRSNATSALTNWGVDLTPPSASAAFSTVKYVEANKFQVNWNFTEINSLKVKSFVKRNTSDAELKDVTTSPENSIDFNVAVPDVNSFNNGSLQFNSIGTYNAFVNETNLGVRTYVDTDTSKQADYTFYAFARDAACNQKVVETNAAIQNPWIMSYNGNVSAAQGYIGLSLPTGVSQFSDSLKDAGGSSIIDDKNSIFISSYGVISGTGDIPLRKVSKNQQYTTNYEDLTIKPPLDSGYSSWYEYVYNTVSKNKSATIVEIAGDQTLAGNTSAMLGVGADTKTHALIQGNLTINSGALCDTKTIFFVAGSANVIDNTYPQTSVKINPDFKTTSLGNGCIFVTPRDILVTEGNRVNSGLSVDSSQLANYDLVEAALITDGQFISTKDVLASNEKGDGLVVKGSIVSSTVSLQRDVNLNANQFQPSQVFLFDPRYRELFKEDLNYKKYSIREIGYQQ